MFETILAIIGGALALWFGGAWAQSSWKRRKLEKERFDRRVASVQQQDMATKTLLRLRADIANRKPIDTKGRSDFE